MATASPTSSRSRSPSAETAVGQLRFGTRDAVDRRRADARDHAAAALPRSASGLGYLAARSPRRHALRRRGAAHPPRGAARLEPARRLLRARRADRSASTRATTRCCSTRSRTCARAATRCSSSSTTRRRSAAPISSSTSGPARGTHGGRVVAVAPPAELRGRTRRRSPGRYLERAAPAHRRAAAARRRRSRLDGARRQRSTTCAASTSRIPLGAWTCVTGVSGSGKSTLVRDVLYRAVRRGARSAGRARRHAPRARGRRGDLPARVEVDQSPIGRTPRSTPASYVGFFDDIRRLFAMTPDARSRGYTASRFSFNVAGGRCETCAGPGSHPHGDELPARRLRRVRRSAAARRFTEETLADPLRRPHDRRRAGDDDRGGGRRSSRRHPPVARCAAPCSRDIGLGYLTLGQPAATRSRAARRSASSSPTSSPRSRAAQTLYVLDEPTTGLHFADTERAGRRAAPAGRPRQHGRHDRAQPRHRSRGGLDRRPGTGRRRGGRSVGGGRDRRRSWRTRPGSHTGGVCASLLAASSAA